MEMPVARVSTGPRSASQWIDRSLDRNLIGWMDETAVSNRLILAPIIGPSRCCLLEQFCVCARAFFFFFHLNGFFEQFFKERLDFDGEFCRWKDRR